MIGQKTVADLKESWNKFGLYEKFIVIGAAAILASFFFPWVSWVSAIPGIGSDTVSGLGSVRYTGGWSYLVPVLAIIAGILLFLFHKKDIITRILMLRWQIIIGTAFSVTGLSTIFLSNVASGLAKTISYGTISLSAGFGLWLIVSGGITILLGAFLSQGQMLKGKR